MVYYHSMKPKSVLALTVPVIFALSLSGALPPPNSLGRSLGPSTAPKIDSNVDYSMFLPPEPYRVWVYRYCAEQHLAVDIPCRVIWSESKWNPKAVNFSVAHRGRGWDGGLPQINSRNVEEWSILYNDGIPIDVMDPQTVIRVAIRRIAFLVRKHGSVRGALIGWNGGSSSVDNPTPAASRYAQAAISLAPQP